MKKKKSSNGRYDFLMIRIKDENFINYFSFDKFFIFISVFASFSVCVRVNAVHPHNTKSIDECLSPSQAMNYKCDMFRLNISFFTKKKNK
jgi:hypothetical protein